MGKSLYIMRWWGWGERILACVMDNDEPEHKDYITFPAIYCQSNAQLYPPEIIC